MKKSIAVLLSMALIISCMMMPVPAFALQEETAYADSVSESVESAKIENQMLPVLAEGTFGNGLTWNIDSNNKLTVSGTGEMPDFGGVTETPWNQYRESITSVEIRKGITNIGNAAFMEFENLTSVILPDSIITIGNNAFYACHSLKSIVLPESITDIGEAAFQYSGLTSVVIPRSVKQIKERTFFGCMLRAVTIPNGVTRIAYAAFADCGLTSVIIPESVNAIDDSAFSGCSSLERVIFESNPEYIGISFPEQTKLIFECNLDFGSITLSSDKFIYNCKPHKPSLTVKTYLGKTLREDVDFTVYYDDNIYAGTAKVQVYGKGKYRGMLSSTFEITTPGTEILFGDEDKTRIYGMNRYETSVEAANELRHSLGKEAFDNIVVASGNGYADALSGAYLAKIKNAPVLLVGDDALSEKYISNYIAHNLTSDGTVYILGGKGAVTQNFENILQDASFNVKRLGGADRYATNMMILNEAGVKREDMLVCSGNGFADCLSASAVGKPILLVNEKLYQEQKNYLNKLSEKNYYVIGGSGAVSQTVENELNLYGKTERLYGANRYATSAAVAREFFGNKTEAAFLAFGDDFPDGLSAGALAASVNAPLLLVTSTNTADAATYIKDSRITKAAVMGGSALISDEAVTDILNS